MATLSEMQYSRISNIINAMELPVPLPDGFDGAKGWVDETKPYALHLLTTLDKMLNECRYSNIELLITEIERLFEAGKKINNKNFAMS